MSTTEVVFYQIKAKKIENYTAISKIADEFLITRKAFINRIVKQDHNDQSIFLDIVEWETLEDALQASEAFKKEASLIPFFEAFEKVISFNHLHTYS